MEAASELKYAAAILVLLAGIGGTMFARRLTSWKSSDVAIRLANAFAGGVFLGAALIHMLPDARENFERIFDKMDYPHFMLLGGIAFLLILLIDKVVTLPHFSHAGQDHDGGAAYPYVLALLLSIHSVITGIALGLEQHLASAIAILVAVLAHKSIAAMALGISLIREKIDEHRSRVLLWTFYTTTPGGIVLGTLVSNQLEGPTQAAVEGLFDAIAGGSFLYISVVDILVEEFKGSQLGRLFLSATSGFLVMAILALWT